MVEHGVDLIIEYTTINEWCIKDLLLNIKNFRNNTVFLELRPSIADIKSRELAQAPSPRFPRGTAASTYKVSRESPSLQRNIPIEISTSLSPVEVAEKCYKALLRIGVF
jgi:hypothetical protein